MIKSDFFKVYGAESREDALIKLRSNKYLIVFGFFTDSDGSYRWRKQYDHKPTLAELKNDINTLINAMTDETILTGFEWNNKPVWLSQENQINFKAAYDLAVQTDGAILPIKFKLGEDSDGNPVYHTFTSLNAFTDFYTKAVAFITAALNAGWQQKDSVDYSVFNCDE